LRERPQDLLRSEHFMGFKNESVDLKDDPIDYRGGALKYTSKTDQAMRRSVSDGISGRHVPQARQTCGSFSATSQDASRMRAGSQQNSVIGQLTRSFEYVGRGS
jgi:hypothetical protein